MFVTLIITFLLYKEKWLCNFCAIPRPLHWMESTSPLRLSTKGARIIGLCATTGAKSARATVCGSCAGSLVSSPLLGTHLPPWLSSSAGSYALRVWAAGSAASGHLSDMVLLPSSWWRALLWHRNRGRVLGVGRSQWIPTLPIRLSGRGRAYSRQLGCRGRSWPSCSPPPQRYAAHGLSGCYYFKPSSRGAC